jgi:hypothetical protein
MTTRASRRRTIFIRRGVRPRSSQLTVASSVQMQRDSSASGDSLRERDLGNDSDGSDHALDLAALRRSTLPHPGTISMLGRVSSRLAKEDTEVVPDADKLRALFDVPDSERIDAGLSFSTVAHLRVPRLARQECHDTGIHGSNKLAHLLLCSSAKDRCILHVFAS